MPATPWLCAYWPVMKVARAGQQSGNESTALAKLVPLLGQQPLHVRHRATSAAAMSSVITTRMFGRRRRRRPPGAPRGRAATAVARRSPGARRRHGLSRPARPSRRARRHRVPSVRIAPTVTRCVTLCQLWRRATPTGNGSRRTREAEPARGSSRPRPSWSASAPTAELNVGEVMGAGRARADDLLPPLRRPRRPADPRQPRGDRASSTRPRSRSRTRRAGRSPRRSRAAIEPAVAVYAATARCCGRSPRPRAADPRIAAGQARCAAASTSWSARGRSRGARGAGPSPISPRRRGRSTG